MHILYLGNKLSHHGKTPTSIETLGPKLNELGFQLNYAGTSKNPILRLWEMVHALWIYRKQIDAVLIDTYSTSAFYYAWLSGFLAKYLSIPYLPILRGGNLPARLKSSPKMCSQLFSNAHVNIALSGYLHDAFKKQGYGTTLIPNTIDIKSYSYKLRSAVTPHLLWVRSFHKIYHPQLAIKVLNRLLEKYPEATLTMVGPDKDGSLQQCKDLVDEKGLSDKVTFTGRLSKQQWMVLSEKCDLFINTTNFDNMPVSVMEAMALGLPLVSTNVGGVPYLIKHNNTGLLVSPNDEQAMVNSIELLVKDSTFVQRLSKEGRDEMEQYDWEVVKEKWKKLLNDVVVPV